jgi:membrane protease YdiL (CAAX protease family)
VYFGGVEVLGDADGPAKDAAAVIAVTLLTSTFQAAGEEYFFRGYLLQAVGSLVRSPVFAVVLTTVLFTMAHGVWPWESPALFLDRFAFGLVAGYLVIRTGGLEAAIAVHAANNVVTFVFAALTDSVGDSLQAADAPWPLVALDVTKFLCFGAAAVLIARCEDCPPPLRRSCSGNRRRG